MDLTPLMTRIRAYLAKSGMTRTEFGVQVTNNGHLWRRLEEGQVTTRTLDRIDKWLKARRPPA